MSKVASQKEFDTVERSEVASQKRIQLQVWEKSDTNKEPDYIKTSRQLPKVKFTNDVVFLAAAQSGDREEVKRLIVEGVDVNSVHSDGLTALHQVQTRIGINTDKLPPHSLADCQAIASQTSRTPFSVAYSV